ncbi:MAG: amino acid--tRNA ligase-related protein, partial [Legionellaceae bacterium]
MSAWKPSASIERLRERAKCIALIRAFFCERGYLEVETPIMGRYGVTDRYIQNIFSTFRGQPYALQTSPEYHMKRLLAAGSGPIFQVARVFRDDELGRWHNPEFTLLEWYQLGVDHLILLQEVDTLLQRVLHCNPLIIKTYQNAFIEACQVDPLVADIPTLKAVLARFDLDHVLPADESCRDQYLYLLMSHVVEPSFSGSSVPVAVIDFPASQAS